MKLKVTRSEHAHRTVPEDASQLAFDDGLVDWHGAYLLEVGWADLASIEAVEADLAAAIAERV